MILRGERLREVSFPVGGIGAGCIGLAGDGRLVDWEIFNKAGKGRRNGISHFAVRAERDGKVVDARILHGDFVRDFVGERGDRDAMFRGYGWGPDTETLAGMPHFTSIAFDGRFPVAHVDFADDVFPAEVSLHAWSPFVPGESDTSSLPVAVFEIELVNRSPQKIRYTCAGVLTNPWRNDTASIRFSETAGIKSLVASGNLPSSDTKHGDLAISTDATDVSHQEYLYRGGWFDSLEVYWKDINTAGTFRNRRYDSARRRHGDSGLIAAHFTLKPGESRRVHFIISWYVPNRENTWDSSAETDALRCGLTGNRWRNYYATLCTGAADAAHTLFAQFNTVRDKVQTFSDALHRSTIPIAALDGASANLAVLVSPTVLRLEDGTLWGWEGVGVELGSCQGTCQHVWGYAQALPLLFPDLERSIRESQARYNFNPHGEWAFRIKLPPGRTYDEAVTPCADGAFGEVLRIYREWKVSGDGDWMARMWPTAKKVLDYAWRPDTRFLWDPHRSGVLTGRCHHTLDVELFGPCGWLQGIYLAALKAAEEMAGALGEIDYEHLCREVFDRGREWTEKHLFNGEYYFQKIDLTDKSVLKPFKDTEYSYWNSEHNELKYQIGDGCSIDSHLGQLFATLCGLGEVLDRGHLVKTLDAIYRHNFKERLRDYANTWRIFALNDESGTLMCTWPEGTRRPAIPIPYHSEVMTGFEWAYATHLVLIGELDRAERVARAIRDRYDGEKRNPWNEIECGNNYARSMAAYGLLQAYSGFHYDMTRGMIGFKPAADGDFRCFWSLGGFWGEYARSDGRQEIRVLHGHGVLTGLAVGPVSGISLNGKGAAGLLAGGEWTFSSPLELRAGDILASAPCLDD